MAERSCAPVSPGAHDQLYTLIGETNSAVGRVEGMLSQHLEHYGAVSQRHEATISQNTRDIQEMRTFQDRMKGAGRFGAILATALGVVIGWFAKNNISIS